MIFSGKYEVTEKVGQGGMGIVYRVRHMDLDTVLALKILPRDLSTDADLVERFRREARVMARLDHRNVVRVFDFVRDGDTYYLTMEFLQGRNLHQILQQKMQTEKRPLELPEVLRIGTQIAEALAYAHGRKPAVVHRDIKPSNIIIEEGSGRAVVTDFGIAKVMGVAQSDLTRSGLFVGTPKYCAPEQLRHDDDLDARVDIYSLGMVLYELFTGRQYFAGLKDHEVIGRVLYEKGENTAECPEAPPEFVQLVERAIARERDARYATAAALAADLQACLELVERGGGSRPEPHGEPGASSEDLERQIRALEVRRQQRLAEEARGECAQARAAAERHAAEAGDAVELAQATAGEGEAQALFDRGEYESAATLFRRAQADFDEAAARAEAFRRERRALAAREAATAIESKAGALGAAALAKDHWARGEELARAAALALGAGEHEKATLQYGEAAEAFGSALAVAERARELHAIQEELPAIAAARAAAERAEAPALAAEAFKAALRDEERLRAALAAEQLTAARALVTEVRERFAAAVTAAEEASRARAARAAREQMAAAAAAARAEGAAEGASAELAAAHEREQAGAAAEAAADWDGALRLYREGAELYERVRTLAQASAEEQRAQRALAEARTGMETARQTAETVAAETEAPTLYGRAQRINQRAGQAAATGDMPSATAEYQRAADQYAQAAQVAERRAQRRAVETALAKVGEARARAEAADAAAAPEFAAAAKLAAEAQHALDADDLETSVARAEQACAAYEAAQAAVELARNLARADAALARLPPCRRDALEAGAEHAAAAELATAEKLRTQAEERRETNDWEAALRFATEAEERYGATLATALAAAEREASAAKEAAGAAGVPSAELAEGQRHERAAVKEQKAGAALAAARGFREAAAAYRAVTERTSAAAQAARTAARAARRAAEEAGAARSAAEAFRKAVDGFEAAERSLAERHFSAAVAAFAESGKRFEGARVAAERARLAERALACRAEAEQAQSAAEAEGAAEILPKELAAAREGLTQATRALEREDFAAAETGFRAATARFGEVLAAGRSLVAEREARAVASKAQVLRAARDPATQGFFARRRIARADRALEEGRRALDGREFAAASVALERAVAILGSVTPVARADDAAAMETVVGTARAPASTIPWLAGGTVALALLVGWFAWQSMRSRPADTSRPGPDVARGGSETERRSAARQEPRPEPTAARAVVQPTAAPAAPATPIEVARAVPPAPPPVERPAPAPPPAPRIAKVEPAQASVLLEKGSSAPLTIEIADASDVSYRWSVGGRVVDGADRPTLSVAAEDEPRRVVVTARSAGGEVSHEWNVAALPRATVQAPTPPVIAGAQPADPTLEVALGSRRRFTVTAKDAAGQRLAYAWTLDGRRAGSDAPSFEFAPTDIDEGGTRRVAVEVRNAANQVASKTWSVRVPTAPVRIVRQSPGREVTAPLGNATELAVEARAGTRTDLPFSYRWTVDGRPVAGATGPRLAYKVDRPSADVEVTVEAPGRQAAAGRWRVRGETLPTPRSPSEDLRPPARVEDASRPPSRGEIDAWIDAYRAAYQEKNVDRLVALGVVPAGQEDKMRRALGDLEDLQVRITARNVDVKPDGTAVVTLTRVDSFLIGGNRTEKTIPITKTLTKRNGVWVAR